MYKAVSSKRISLDLEALQLVNTDFPGEKAKEKKGQKQRASVHLIITNLYDF